MCEQKLSLFDALILEINHDLKPYLPAQIPTLEMVPYTISREDSSSSFVSTGRMVAIQNLIPGLRKRYIGATSSVVLDESDREAAAIVEFLDDNKRCKRFNDTFDVHRLSGFVQTVLGEAQVLLDEALNSHNGTCLTLSNVARLMRVGPGASNGCTGDTGSYARLAGGVMTFSSPDVAGAYKACMLTSRLTATAEAVRYSEFGQLDSYNTVAKFITVPKTNVQNRGICTQPSGNMILQLGTHGILTEQLKKHFGCDLESQQDSNRTLAYLGSKGRRSLANHSWEFCTVDLSRASNFPWVVIETLFPELWCQWLDLIRSPKMEILGQQVPKHMCSTMGNGFTFSLMTILLSSIVKSLYRLAGLPEYDEHHEFGRIKTWAVYGDDIIVDKTVFRALLQVLDSLGFIVNSKKTFSEGLFRESCGADYYDGYPVRPVFCETLQTEADVYSLINRLVLWGVTHSVDLTKGLTCLRNYLGTKIYRVPNWEDVSGGLHVPFSMCDQNPQFIPKRIKLSMNKGNVAYCVRRAVNKHRVLYTEKTEPTKYIDPASYKLYTYNRTVEVKVKAQNLNIPGMLLCMLEGSVLRGRYGLRPMGPPRYEEIWTLAPGWGDPSLFSHTATRVFSSSVTSSVYRLWEEYVRRNISKRVLRS